MDDYQQLSLFDSAPVAVEQPDRSLTSAQRCYLTGPLIGHGAWVADIPPWLKEAIVPARQAMIQAEEQNGEHDLASLEETLAYLMSASFDAPLDHDYARLFFWTAAQVLTHHRRVASVEELGQALGDVGEVAPLSDYQQRELLNPLRRKIRAAVVKHARQRDKAAHL